VGRSRHLQQDSAPLPQSHGTLTVTRHLLHRATVPSARHGTFSRPRFLQEEATVPSATDGSQHNRAATLNDQDRAAKTKQD